MTELFSNQRNSPLILPPRTKRLTTQNRSLQPLQNDLDILLFHTNLHHRFRTRITTFLEPNTLYRTISVETNVPKEVKDLVMGC